MSQHHRRSRLNTQRPLRNPPCLPFSNGAAGASSKRISTGWRDLDDRLGGGGGLKAGVNGFVWDTKGEESSAKRMWVSSSHSKVVTLVSWAHPLHGYARWPCHAARCLSAVAIHESCTSAKVCFCQVLPHLKRSRLEISPPPCQTLAHLRRIFEMIAITSQIDLDGGGGGGLCVYWDESGSAVRERCRKVAQEAHLDPDEVEDTIVVSAHRRATAVR